MRKQGWNYMSKNATEGENVAYFVNRKGRTVFYVTAVREGYVTTNVINGIKSHFISYSDARKLNSEVEEKQKDSKDILFTALVHACEMFEENYNEQVKQLLEQF